jgi:hypothetical protein
MPAHELASARNDCNNPPSLSNRDQVADPGSHADDRSNQTQGDRERGEDDSSVNEDLDLAELLSLSSTEDV